MEVKRICPMCGKSHSMDFTEKELSAWQYMLIQKAMPTRTDEEREFLISGMCIPCQKEFFCGDEG